MKRFTEKVVLVTGAAQGLGRGIALCFAQAGANLIINDYANLAEAEDLAAEVRALGGQALVIQADVSDREAVVGMMARGMAHFGRLDVAVANAAQSVREPVLQAKWQDVQRTIEVTQFGVFHLCQLAAQQMVKQERAGDSRGKIVIIGSVRAQLSVPGSAAYNMAKAAINHFGRTLATELAAQRINVNVVNPGWCDTPGERKYFSEAELHEAGKKAIPWGRLGQPEEIGQAVCFLASQEADYITGAALTVDGGFVLGLNPHAEDEENV